MGYHARYDTDLLHVESKVSKLEPRRVCHLTNFVYHRAYNPKYIKVAGRQLRRYNAPVMTKIVANTVYSIKAYSIMEPCTGTN